MRQTSIRGDDVAEFLRHLRVDARPFEIDLVLDAKAAYARFGKGTWHPAVANATP